MITNILCDLDGVLSDFFSLALEKLNETIEEPIAPMSVQSYCHIAKFDMAEVFGITQTEFWETIQKGDKFWSHLKPFPWAQDLLAFLETIAPVTICTSPSLNHVCAMQKTQWCEKHLGLKNTSLMIGSRKYLMARESNLLIDDYDKNVKAFTDAGGRAIQVPSNWNTFPLSFDLVKDAIVKQL